MSKVTCLNCGNIVKTPDDQCISIETYDHTRQLFEETNEALWHTLNERIEHKERADQAEREREAARRQVAHLLREQSQLNHQLLYARAQLDQLKNPTEDLVLSGDPD